MVHSIFVKNFSHKKYFLTVIGFMEAIGFMGLAEPAGLWGLGLEAEGYLLVASEPEVGLAFFSANLTSIGLSEPERYTLPFKNLMAIKASSLFLNLIKAQPLDVPSGSLIKTSSSICPNCEKTSCKFSLKGI